MPHTILPNTKAGRVVYDRKKHLFKPRDVYRILAHALFDDDISRSEQLDIVTSCFLIYMREEYPEVNYSWFPPVVKSILDQIAKTALFSEGDKILFSVTLGATDFSSAYIQ